MAYIKPEGTIYLLQRIPLRPDLNMTIYPWASKETQFNWFLKHKLYTYEGTTRVRGNTVMVEIETDRVLHCNYMMFQNKGYSNKWFYAFVTNVEFVNNVTTRLTFQLDLFQSWCFDWDIQPCFVDREHVNDDTIGANTVPENLETGEYICRGSSRTGAFNELSCELIFAPVPAQTILDPPAEYPVPAIIKGATIRSFGKIFCGAARTQTTGQLGIQQAIDWLNNVGYGNNVACVAMYPSAFGDSGSVGLSIERPSYGFTPKNNKLFTYPYVYAEATNAQGYDSVFGFEYFTDPTKASFSVYGSAQPNFVAVMQPVGYKGGFNAAHRSSLAGFPVGCYTNDGYQTWLAQTAASRSESLKYLETVQSNNFQKNAYDREILQRKSENAMLQTGVSLISGVVGTIASKGMTASMDLSSISNAATTSELLDLQKGALNVNYEAQQAATQYAIDSINASVQDHSKTGSSVGGAIAGNTEINNNLKDFYLYAMSIKDEFARIIDDYFSLYGYAVHRVKVPNFEGRYTWNYVKTAGCVFKGYDIPLQMQMQLAASLDAGMTFWHTPDNFGDYTQDNSIK